MDDLVSRLLEAITAQEASADKDASNTHTRYRIGGTYSGRRHVDVARRDGILRRCAADRRTVERCAAILAVRDWEYEDTPDLARKVLADRAVAYGLSDHQEGEE